LRGELVLERASIDAPHWTLRCPSNDREVA
jgi:hypothetical protein